MGQNNDPAEPGELQGSQGGQLVKDPKKEIEIRLKDDGYARTREKPEHYVNPKQPQNAGALRGLLPTPKSATLGGYPQLAHAGDCRHGLTSSNCPPQ